MKSKKVKVPDGLSSQVGTMIEHFDDKLSLIAEQLGHVSEVVNEHTEILNYHSESIEIIKMDIEFIKNDLRRKVGIDDFQALERRVALLENRR